MKRMVQRAQARRHREQDWSWTVYHPRSSAENPGIYLRDIQRHVETISGVMVSESAICRFLQQKLHVRSSILLLLSAVKKFVKNLLVTALCTVWKCPGWKWVWQVAHHAKVWLRPARDGFHSIFHNRNWRANRSYIDQSEGSMVM